MAKIMPSELHVYCRNYINEMINDNIRAIQEREAQSDGENEGNEGNPPPFIFESPRSIIDPQSFIDLTQTDDESEPVGSDDSTMNTEQEREVGVNGLIILLNNIKATLRFMRVDIHRLEDIEINAITTAMHLRIEDIETMIDRFEDTNIVRRNLFNN